MNYQFNSDKTMLIRDDGVWFPANPLNSNYPDYLLWVEEGNVAEVIVPPIGDVRRDQIVAISTGCQRVLAGITACYPDLEIATWPQQLAEAQSFSNDANSATPLLGAIAAACRQSVESLVEGVREKAAAYQAASGAAIGKRLALTAQIYAAEDVDSIKQINW
ncbi:hypothetical protein PQR34_47555 [Paraburkholderia sediminicola]|uniref:hypothetical protein n=1 Tax=Paraburkholderia sediminicola TaxID=458836 RepID=UPI0038BCAE3C